MRPELGDTVRTPAGRVGRVIHLYQGEYGDTLAFVRIVGQRTPSRFTVAELTPAAPELDLGLIADATTGRGPLWQHRYDGDDAYQGVQYCYRHSRYERIDTGRKARDPRKAR